MNERDKWNACRYRTGDAAGHYESYFQRANHPERPLAFWVRYTIFSPKDRPRDAIGELWAIWFDGETDTITAVKKEVPYDDCRFSLNGLDVAVADATLDQTSCVGSASLSGHTIDWNLSYEGGGSPLLFIPEYLYEPRLPKAKYLVGSPNTRFSGTITVDGVAHRIDEWVGSQNHNWGSEHTHRYAWAQVAGFDDDPDSFLECGSARLKIGPFETPRLTAAVLRTDGVEYRLNTPRHVLRARSDFSVHDRRLWFRAKDRDTELEVVVEAPRSRFVGLTYFNPPGGTKTCLNSKLASCEVTLRRSGRTTKRMRTESRAALELLTDARDHGIPMAT